jgi:hypothetical protein
MKDGGKLWTRSLRREMSLRRMWRGDPDTKPLLVESDTRHRDASTCETSDLVLAAIELYITSVKGLDIRFVTS